jgi:phosphatidylinositol alpha-1,6-mannosyltransferase
MKKSLFLNLTAFSKTGGLEKFNRSFLKAMNELKGINNSCSHSAYDTVADEKYYPQRQYKGFAGKLAPFIINSVIKAARYDEVIVGHINVAIVGCLIKTLYPSKKVTLITHGVEVWEPVGGFKKKLLQKADSILAVSTFTKNKVIEVHRIPAGKVQVFPNTIDPYFPVPLSFDQNMGLRLRYGLKENDFVLFTLARLSSKEQYKGYDIVIECLPALLKIIPGIKYIIAGKYDEAEKGRVEGIIGRLHLENNVILAGYVADNELTDHYRMSDLFIMPSQGEGFGIVFLEAMICGLQVIGGNRDGSVDALQNGALGTLVTPDNKEEIINSVLEHYKRRAVWTEKDKYRLQQDMLGFFGFDKFKQRLKNIFTDSARDN